MTVEISVSGLCFPDYDLDRTLGALGELGVARTTLPAAMLTAGGDAGGERIRAAGVAVAALIGPLTLRPMDRETWAEARSELVDALDTAAAVGASTVYFVTGPRGGAPWDDAVEGFTEAVAPALAHAARTGVRLAIEPVNPLYADLSFVHTLRDALELGERSGVGVCLDVFHIWTEPRLPEAIAEAGAQLALVQLSDYVPGDRAFPCRAVPGDGVIPLADLLSAVRASGYDGVIDVELTGPRIDAEGHIPAARRAISRISDTLP